MWSFKNTYVVSFFLPKYLWISNFWSSTIVTRLKMCKIEDLISLGNRKTLPHQVRYGRPIFWYLIKTMIAQRWCCQESWNGTIWATYDSQRHIVPNIRKHHVLVQYESLPFGTIYESYGHLVQYEAGNDRQRVPKYCTFSWD